MRNFINISQSKNDALNALFPEILDISICEQVKEYDQFALCVFDHWLSIEEARKEISDMVVQGHEEFHNQKFKTFMLDLANETEIYLIKFLGRNKSKVTFRKFLSKSSLEKVLTPKNHLVSDSFRFRILLPELNTIYFEGCDFTHHFYCKKPTEPKLIRKVANKNSLYVLK